MKSGASSSYAARFARDRFGLEVFNGTIEAFAEAHRDIRFPSVYSTDVIAPSRRPRTEGTRTRARAGARTWS